MFKLTGGGCGEIYRVSLDTSPSGRECVAATVQFQPRRFDNGTVYRQRVRVISYQQDIIDAVDKLHPGSWISFGGEIDALAEIGAGGKWYANPRVIGSISLHDSK